MALTLAIMPFPLHAGPSSHESELLRGCLDNVDPEKDRLSPAAAEECVKALSGPGGETIIKKYAEEDQEGALRLIGDNNALVDLRNIVTKQSGHGLAMSLSFISEKNPFHPMKHLRLGPKPEDLFGWIGKHAGDSLAKTQQAVRTWDALGPVRTKSLSSPEHGSRSRDSWNSQDIKTRYAELSKWARKETEKLFAATALLPAKRPEVNPHVLALATVLREDLIFPEDMASREKLDMLARKFGDKEAATAGRKTSAVEKKAGELRDIGTELGAAAAKGTEARRAYLGQTFDNSPVSGAGPALPVGTLVKPVPMTAGQEIELGSQLLHFEEGKLKGPLSEILAKTKSGQRAIAFFEDRGYAKTGGNKLDFGFIKAHGELGRWDPETKTIRLNSLAAEEFAAKRGLTVAQMMKSPADIKDFALYISPSFVHEAEHQNQAARAASQGINYKEFHGFSRTPYSRALENLSNKESVEHILEYCSQNGGPACFTKLHPMHVNDAEKYIEGGLAALDSLKAPLYPDSYSFEGVVGVEFKKAQQSAAELKTLEALLRANPSSMTEEQKLKMASLRKLLDTRFKWYVISYSENSAAERSSLEFRSKYTSGRLDHSGPPEL